MLTGAAGRAARSRCTGATSATSTRPATRLGALDGLAAARRAEPAVAHRRRRRGHHRAPAARGGRARARGGRGIEPREERLPLAHEPRAAHAAQRDARLRPAARARPAPSADADAQRPVGRADPAGRLAPARDDQRRARPVAHRVGQPAPADRRRSTCAELRRGDVGAGRERRRAGRGITISAGARRRHVGAARRRDARQADPHQPAQQRRQVQHRQRPHPHRQPARGAGRGRGLGDRHRPGHDAEQMDELFQPVQPARPRAHRARGHRHRPRHQPAAGRADGRLAPGQERRRARARRSS